MIDITPEGLIKFKAVPRIGFELKLYDKIIKDESKWDQKGSKFIMRIAKANKNAAFWPQLSKENIKNGRIKADWSKWVDEEEEKDA